MSPKRIIIRIAAIAAMATTPMAIAPFAQAATTTGVTQSMPATADQITINSIAIVNGATQATPYLAQSCNIKVDFTDTNPSIIDYYSVLLNGHQPDMLLMRRTYDETSTSGGLFTAIVGCSWLQSDVASSWTIVKKTKTGTTTSVPSIFTPTTVQHPANVKLNGATNVTNVAAGSTLTVSFDSGSWDAKASVTVLAWSPASAAGHVAARRAANTVQLTGTVDPTLGTVTFAVPASLKGRTLTVNLLASAAGETPWTYRVTSIAVK